VALTDEVVPVVRAAWELSPVEVADQQGVDRATGLDSDTVAARTVRDGPNEVPMHPATDSGPV
jgi:hypothetical protein